MEAGHGGASGRYERYRETALHYAFLLERGGCDWRRAPATIATGAEEGCCPAGAPVSGESSS